MRFGFIDAGITDARMLGSCKDLRRCPHTLECLSVARGARADPAGARMDR
jgi:hypothetical protein